MKTFFTRNYCMNVSLKLIQNWQILNMGDSPLTPLHRILKSSINRFRLHFIWHIFLLIFIGNNKINLKISRNGRPSPFEILKPYFIIQFRWNLVWNPIIIVMVLTASSCTAIVTSQLDQTKLWASKVAFVWKICFKMDGKLRNIY